MIGGGLSDYKPSNLLVEIPDNNIDTKLGVKNLVLSNGNSNNNKTSVIHQNSKTKNNIETANNNSSQNNIIYAQSNILKNGFNSSNTNKTNGLSIDSKNIMNFDNRSKEYSTNNNSGNKINGVTYSFNGASNNNQTQQHSNVLDNSKSNNFSQSTTINSKLGRHADTIKNKTIPTNEIVNTLNSSKNDNSKEDLNLVNDSNKWSNGTSDILF